MPDLDQLSPHALLARDELHERSSVSSPTVSPDGSHVASVVTTIDHDANTTRSSIWLDGAPLTSGPRDGEPTWSPDGRCLAFVRGADDEASSAATLRVLDVTGSAELRTLCSLPEDIAWPTWSPDGSTLAFLSRTRDERYDAKDERWQPPRRIDRFFTRLDEEGWIVDRPRHVYVVAADGTGESRNLTPGPAEHHAVTWTADSTAIVTSAARHDTWDRDLCTDLYLIDLEGHERPLTHQTGVYGSPVASPDGEWIAFLGYDDPLLFPQLTKVGIVRPDGTDRRWISADLDRNFESVVCPSHPVWLDDRSLATVVEDRGTVQLCRVDVDGAAPTPITDGASSVVGFHHAGGTLAIARSDVTQPGELHVVRDGTERRITSVTRSRRGWQHFVVPCDDGTGEIDAWLMLPDHEPDARLPVLLNVHGGPFTQYGEIYFEEAQMQAAAGFAVLMCNPRGGSGRDTPWAHAINGPKHPIVAGAGWGTVDVDDVLSVLTASLARFEVLDRERVGMLGGSYGGFMATLLAARHGDRFRAICSERAANNMLNLEWSSDIGSASRIEQGPDPVEDPDEYWRLSPVRLARDIHVPMLLIHSEHDFRCPINQAEELWMTLRMLDRDVTFYRFPGEGHGLSRSGSPHHRRQRAEILLDFFSHHLDVAR